MGEEEVVEVRSSHSQYHYHLPQCHWQHNDKYPPYAYFSNK
jgi:hypothetical protein